MPSPYKGFLWRENEEPMFRSFHPLADKTNNERRLLRTLNEYFSRSHKNRSMYRQTGFPSAIIRFIDKLAIFSEPTVPSARLLGLGFIL